MAEFIASVCQSLHRLSVYCKLPVSCDPVVFWGKVIEKERRYLRALCPGSYLKGTCMPGRTRSRWRLGSIFALACLPDKTGESVIVKVAIQCGEVSVAPRGFEQVTKRCAYFDDQPVR